MKRSGSAKLWVFLGAILGLVVIACAPTAPAPGAERLTLRVATVAPERDILSRSVKFWGDLVTERTAGRIQFQYFYAGSLLSVSKMFEGVRDGLSEVGSPATSYVSGIIPDLAVLEVPFAYPLDEKFILRFMDEVNPIVDELFQEHNQKLIFSNPAITGDPVTCKGKFLSSAEAWKGALVRTAGRWQSETLRVWGAKPVFLPLGDLYTALQRRTVDCTLLVYNLLDSFRIHEVADHVTRIDHSINYSTVTINLEVWDRLSPEDQRVLLDAGREAQRRALEMRREETVRVIEKFKGLGVKFCTPSASELRRLRDATKVVWERIKQQPGFTERGQRIMDIAAKWQDKVAPGPVEGDMTPCP